MRGRRTAGGDAAVPQRFSRVPVAQIAATARAVDDFVDDRFAPMRARIREIAGQHERDGDRLLPMATMVRASDGGALRTFSGGLAHENGWISCLKAKRILHWEGVAQRALIIRSMSDFAFIDINTECMRLEYSDGVTRHQHTIDVLLTRPDNSLVAVEVKRDEHDLRDVHLRRTLAGAHEIYRRCGIDFVIAFRDEIFADRHHRRNAELFASRQNVRIDRLHMLRLEDHAAAHGVRSTYGRLAEALEPASYVHGLSVLQALAVQRRVEIDIVAPLTRDTELTIH